MARKVATGSVLLFIRHSPNTISCKYDIAVNVDSAGAKSVAKTARIYYLDWLRVLSMLAVFLFHNSRFFDFGGWHIKNAELYLGFSIFSDFLGLWIMPFLFTISGAAVFYSLKSRNAGQFSQERLLRLLVPLVVFGLLVFGMLQIYLERLSHGEFSGSFWQFFPHYFEGLYAFGGNFAWMGVHLWYLLVLLVLSFILLPLLIPFRKGNQSLILKLSFLFDRPWALFLLFIPLILMFHLTNALGMENTREMGGWDLFTYTLFFIYGYLLVASPRIVEIVSQYRFASLGIAIALSITWITMRYTVASPLGSGFFFSAELRTICSWFWVLAILGLGRRYLNSNNTYLSYTNEAVLPFYILHQPIILVIGFFVVQWAVPPVAKYGFITVSSFIVIMVIYEILVRRLKILRFLFGMKLGKKTQVNAIPVVSESGSPLPKKRF